MLKKLFMSKASKKFMRYNQEDNVRYSFYKQFINNSDIVFDVGANIGNRTKIFRNLAAKVIAFEPQSICFNKLTKACKPFKNIKVLKLGLSEKPGKENMLLADAHTISTLNKDWPIVSKNSGRFNEYNWDDKEEIELTTLDLMIEKFGKPQFIKIDVEGYEYEVLKGLNTSIPYISFEFSSELFAVASNCIEYLSSLALTKYNISLGESMEFYNKEWLDKEEIIASLKKVIQDDPLAWGDIYTKQV